MTALSRTIDTLGRLIAYPTISTDSNLAIIEDLAARLEAAGARVEIQRDPTGEKANVYAAMGPEAPGGVLLSGHSDVVPVAEQDWSSDPFAMDARDGLLYGRGTCDMKGFIACAVTLAEDLAGRDLTRPVHFAFTHDEETGCLGAQNLLNLLRGRDDLPSVAIIGEPTLMRIIEGHKGCFEYTARFTGLEGHGSNPDRGVNAAEYAARYVGRLLELGDALKSRAPEGSRFEPPWTTINVGSIHGGTAHNVIAGKAEVEWDMRPVQPADADFVKDEIGAYVEGTLLPAMRAVHPEADITVETIGEVAGLEPMETNAARDLAAELTGGNIADVVPFGTEAGLFQSLGIDVVVCGPGSIDQAHKPDEFVAEEQLAACLDMLARLGARLERR